MRSDIESLPPLASAGEDGFFLRARSASRVLRGDRFGTVGS